MAQFAKSQLKINGLDLPVTVQVTRNQIEVTSDRESPDPNWTHTDRQGHNHFYNYGYPTLDLVITKRHYCDGTEGFYNHDPHWVIDESYYRCNKCGEEIEPGVLPPFTRQYVPGVMEATAEVQGDAGEEFELDYQGQAFRFVRVSMDVGRDGTTAQYVGGPIEIG